MARGSSTVEGPNLVDLAVCIWGFTDVDEKEGGREQKIWLVFGRKDSRDDFGKCRYIEAQYMIIFA